MITNLIVWLLITTGPNGAVVQAKLPSQEHCFLAAEALFRDSAIAHGKCIRSFGTLAPV